MKLSRLIFSGAEALESNPEIGRRGTIEGTRELVIKRYPYTLIYKLTPSKAIVLNVLHQSRQYP